MLQQSIVVAAISLCGVLFGATLQYTFGRALESRKQLALQKTQSYVDYFKALAEIAQSGRSKERLALIADAKTRICIYGSPSVISSLHRFEQGGPDTGTSTGRVGVVRLLGAMRKDIDGHSLDAPAVQEVLFGARDTFGT